MTTDSFGAAPHGERPSGAAYAAAAGCPVAHDVDPFAAEYLADPYAVFDALREQAPLHYSPVLDMWLVTRYADVETIFRDTERFSASLAQSPVSALADEALSILTAPGGPVPVMSNLDPPEHSRLRKINNQTFSVRRITVLEPPVRKRVAELVEALPDEGEVDLVRALTYPTPALTIFTLLGFPEGDADRLKAWSDDRMLLIWGRLPAERQAQIARNFRAFFAYCVEHVERRFAEPADDFTSDLVRRHREDPASISKHEIASIVFGLSFAGHETTTNLLSNCVRTLAGQPEVWRSLQRDPEQVALAVEEVLRLDSSVICWRRMAKQDVEIGGTVVPAGAKLLLLLGSANRDPEVFDRPEEFVVGRPNARRHLSLGKGIHFCLGAPLARLQAQIVLETLLRERPDLEVVADQELEFAANVSFRGPKQLLVRAPRRRQ